MDNALAMKPSDSNGQFPKHPPSFTLQQPPAFHQVIEQLSTTAQFTDEPYVRLRRDNLVEVNDVRVMQAPVVV